MGNSKYLSTIVFLLLAYSGAVAQENRYMVFFKDKTGIPQTLSKPIEFLSEKAIQRRLEQNIEITELDLPVRKDYVQGVRDTGADTFFTTRWLNAVLVQCEESLLPAIEALGEKTEKVEKPADGYEPLKWSGP